MDKKDTIKILIGGDVVPTADNLSLFESGNTEELVGQEIISIIEGTDVFIFNLEAPLTDRGEPIKKSGPHLRGSKKSIEAISKLRPQIVSLANNHILDYGEVGLADTISLLKQEDIDIIGAGNNINDVNKHKILNIKGKKIGFFSCAEHEFTIATKKLAGANPYDPLNSFDDVRELKNQVDYVIVLFHGGKEYYRYVSPNLQKICRKFVDAGADFITCQHSHCIGSKEEYNGKTILYGQGNFIFTYRDRAEWKEGLLVELCIEDDISATFIPFYKDGNKIRLAKNEKYNDIIAPFLERSNSIKDTQFVEREWQKFCKEYSVGYLRQMIPLSFIEKVINKLTGGGYFLYKKVKKRDLLPALLNNYQCQAHKEVIEQILKQEL